jgi:hypothetical protein
MRRRPSARFVRSIEEEMSSEAHRPTQIEGVNLLRCGRFWRRLLKPSQRLPQLWPKVRRDFRDDALTLQILQLLRRGFRWRLVRHDIEMNVVFFTIGEVAVNALALSFPDVRELASPTSPTPSSGKPRRRRAPGRRMALRR